MSLRRASATAAAAAAAVALLTGGPAAAQPGPAPGPTPVPVPVPTPGVDSAHAAGTVPGPAAGTVPIPVAAPAANCSDIEVIFARGTDDTPGLGTNGRAFVDALRLAVGARKLTTYAVDYPASYDFLAAADGAADATNRITALADECPTTKIVLGGYSQGAAVMDMLGGVPPLGNKIGDIGSAPPLPADLLPNIAAVAVFGNPSTKFSRPITTGVFGGKAIDLCKDGDPICSRGRNPFAHNDYISAGLIQQAASFVAGRV